MALSREEKTSSGNDESLEIHENRKNQNADEKKRDSLLERFEKWFDSPTKFVWENIFLMSIWHVLMIYFIFTFPFLKYKGLMLWAIVLAELNILGNTAGCHRLWCHRSYKAKFPVRLFLAVVYISSGMNRISHWVRNHRVHHKYTDTDADPHNSSRGFFFCHIGWYMVKGHPEITRVGKQIDYSDMKADPIVVFFDKHFVVAKILLCFILPVFIPVVFFGQELGATIITQWFFRYPYAVHSIFAINSFAHMFGSRSYDKTIRPTENAFVSLVATGEGWHNYHHSFPWDYKASEYGSYFFNRATGFIDLCGKFGLASDFKQVDAEYVKRIVERKGDGSHAVYVTKENQDKIELVEEPPY